MSNLLFPSLRLPAGSQWLFFSAGLGGQYPPGGGAPNPFAPPPDAGAPTPRRKSNAWIWILVILAGGGLLVLACCGIGGYFAVSASNTVITQALRQEIEGNPTVEEHLGTIESLQTNLIETGDEAGKHNTTNNIIVVDAKGSKGTGKFIVEQSPNPQPGNIFHKIDLRLPGGEEVSVK